MLTGAQLMTRAQAGDIDAFGELYARYHPQVLLYARSRAPRYAEDIAQDVFVRVLGSLARYQDQGKDPGAWLRTITVNLCRDRLKAAEHRLAQPAADMPDVEARADQTDPSLLVVEDLARRDVLTALLRLSDLQREAMVLYYLRDLSVAQVAERMGKGRVHVRRLLHDGRRAMARHLGEVDRG